MRQSSGKKVLQESFSQKVTWARARRTRGGRWGSGWEGVRSKGASEVRSVRMWGGGAASGEGVGGAPRPPGAELPPDCPSGLPWGWGGWDRREACGPWGFIPLTQLLWLIPQIAQSLGLGFFASLIKHRSLPNQAGPAMRADGGEQRMFVLPLPRRPMAAGNGRRQTWRASLRPASEAGFSASATWTASLWVLSVLPPRGGRWWERQALTGRQGETQVWCMRSGEALSECFRADLLTCLFTVTSSSSSSDRSPLRPSWVLTSARKLCALPHYLSLFNWICCDLIDHLQKKTCGTVTKHFYNERNGGMKRFLTRGDVSKTRGVRT